MSNDLLLSKNSAFISTEYENLWIASRLLWFHQPRPPENSLMGREMVTSMSGLWTKMIQFQEPVRLPAPLNQQEVVMENYAQTPKILFINVCFHYKWLMVIVNLFLRRKRDMVYE